MSLVEQMTDRFGIFGELLVFLWARKLWWMIPMILILMLFTFILLFATQTGLAPFIYPIF